MKQSLIDLVNNTNSRVLGQVLKSKTNADILNYIEDTITCDVTATMKEKVYNVINNPVMICHNNNTKKFNGVEYKYCGSPRVCECHREGTKRNVLLLDRTQVEITKKHNNLKKYGVENVMQVPEIAQKVHSNRATTLSQKTRDNMLESGFNTVIDRVSTSVSPLFDVGDYNGSFRKNFYLWKCNVCNNEFEDHVDYGRVPVCKICKPPVISKGELEVGEFIKTLEDDVVLNSRAIIPPLELDIYVPSKKIAIEYNGVYWHSTFQKGKYYHVDKFLKCRDEGVHLIQIFEDEWVTKPTIIMNRLKAILGHAPKLHGRKTVASKIPNEEGAEFVNDHHIQGKASCSVSYGLHHRGDLVAVMTFGRSRYHNTENAWELIRYCSIGTVVGGASKLFKQFMNDYNPSEIVSYANRCWSYDGGLYKALGFTNVTESDRNVGYYYIKNNKRHHRSSFTKKRLVEMGYDESLTEETIMINNGFLKIHDAGNYKFQINNSNK